MAIATVLKAARGVTLLVLGGIFLYVARMLSPLAGYDTPFYVLAYWSIMSIIGAAIGIAALLLVGVQILRSALDKTIIALSWPVAATNSQFIVIVATILTLAASIPHYRWAVHVGSGGTAPFSALEVSVMVFIWWPLLNRMSEPTFWSVLAMVAITWLVFGAGASALWCRVRPQRTLSALGVMILALPASCIGLWFLRTVSPYTLPW